MPKKRFRAETDRDAKTRPTILFIIHVWGGGTIRFAHELADLISDRVDVVWAWGVDNTTIHISTRAPYEAEQSFNLAEGLDAPLRALNAFKLNRVNVIHTIGLQAHIADLMERLAVPYDVTLTDYHHFYGAPHFEDHSGRFIGDAAVAAIARTARSNIPPLLRKAERRIAVSQDLAYRAGTFMPGFPIIPVRIVEPNIAIDAPVKIAPLADCEVMRVLALGKPHLTKGRATIVDVARRAERENFPMEIICLGELDPTLPDILSALPRVRTLGAYRQEELAGIIAQLKPHLAWFPFNVPETHSYALSDVMSFGLPVLASGIGAVAERVVRRPSTWVVPFDDVNADNFFHWFERLYRDRLQTPPHWQLVDNLPLLAKNFYPSDYLDPISN